MLRFRLSSWMFMAVPRILKTLAGKGREGVLHMNALAGGCTAYIRCILNSDPQKGFTYHLPLSSRSHWQQEQVHVRPSRPRHAQNPTRVQWERAAFVRLWVCLSSYLIFKRQCCEYIYIKNKVWTLDYLTKERLTNSTGGNTLEKNTK